MYHSDATDAGDLVGASFMFGVEPCDPRTLDEVIFENYLEGLLLSFSEVLIFFFDFIMWVLLPSKEDFLVRGQDYPKVFLLNMLNKKTLG